MTCPTCGQLPPPFSPPPSPRFSELLSTNAPPPDAEAAGLRHIIQDLNAYIDSVQSQIVKVQETLSALKGLQEDASRIMADTQRILHPMRSLPQDILVEIFLCCTPIVNHYEINWSVDGDDFDSLHPSNHPWNISHVSHRWREIALSLPRLWSVIYLDFTRCTPLSMRRDYFLGSLLFERSANLDLCVNIASGEMDIRTHPLMSLLKESTTRWRTLYSYMTSQSLQSLSGCEFPLLHALGMRNEVPDDGIEVPVDTFKNVQNIGILDIYPSYDCDFEGYETLGEFPWSKLSKITCIAILKPSFLPGFQQSTSLEELTITLDYIDSSFWVELSGSIISFPALKHLEVTNCADQEDNIEKFLHILQIPSICCLTVAFATRRPLHYSPLVPHPDFHRISTLHVTCTMTKPSSRSGYIGGARTLLQFLAPMSGVVEFRLEDERVTTEFLDGLVVEEKGAVLLPSLKILDLHRCGFSDHHKALILMPRIVESRALTRLCPPLEKVVLPQEDWLNEVFVDGIQRNPIIQTEVMSLKDEQICSIDQHPGVL